MITPFCYRVSFAPLQFYANTALGQHNKAVLDLCCGTGQLALHFLEKGYNVTGLDLSPSMLHYAQENAKAYVEAGQAAFIEGDAADFTLDAQFGLVISTFDALNHLPDMTALRGCFRSVYAVLEPDGYFVFDLNTREGLWRWAGINVQDSKEAMIVNRGFVLEDQGRAYAHITGFVQVKDGLYERFEQTAYNTMFDLGVVQSALEDARFRGVIFAHVEDLATSIPEPEKEPRVFIVAQK